MSSFALMVIMTCEDIPSAKFVQLSQWVLYVRKVQKVQWGAFSETLENISLGVCFGARSQQWLLCMLLYFCILSPFRCF